VNVLLRRDVDGLGKKGDIVDVADGYARNFLIPKDLAVKASKGVEAQAQAMRRSRDLKDAADRSAAEEIAKRLVPTTITIVAKAGAEGRLFGSVTAVDVVDAVREQTGVELDRKSLSLDEHIKETGTHQVATRLHADVQFQITLDVVPA
jgi:large subunit ribosomal protein L9